MNSEHLAHWRKIEMGWTQAELASRLGVTRRQVIRWEAGHNPISRVVALACAALQHGLEAPQGDHAVAGAPV